VSKKQYGEQNGKEPPKGRLASLRGRLALRQDNGSQADYNTATPGWIAAAIIAVTKQGGAIQFGYSRDGGVYTIVILLDGEIEKNYVKQSEGIDAFLEGIYTAFTSGDGSE
jgi:hypothetical protein